MKVVEEDISEELYGKFLSLMPQVSVELALERNGEVLLARRNNEPGEGKWFWPGSRLRKGEGLEDAARRVAREELGIEIKIVKLLGVYSHFWEESEIEGVDSLHTVNVVYHVEPVGELDSLELDDQHDDYRFISRVKPNLHEYVKRYLHDSQILK